MAKRMRRVLSSILLMATVNIGCAKTSSIEGQIVDWKGAPLPGIKVIAIQSGTQLKGFERSEAISGTGGTFVLRNLYPSSRYEIRPVATDPSVAYSWGFGATIEAESVQSAPVGHTAKLPRPWTIAVGRSRIPSSVTPGAWADIDPRTHQLRFQLVGGCKSVPCEAIYDSFTGLHWYFSGMKTTWDHAQQYVSNLERGALTEWRLPTEDELKLLEWPRVWNGTQEIHVDMVWVQTGILLIDKDRSATLEWSKGKRGTVWAVHG